MKTKHLGGLLLLALLTLAACDANNPADDMTEEDGFDISLYEGTYTGTVNSNPSLTPPTPVDVTITAEESNQTATLITDFGPIEEGDDDPEPIVLDGTYDDQGATFTGEQNGADYEIIIDRNGNVTGQQIVIFAGETLTFDVEGTITSSDLELELDGELPEGTDLPLPAGTPVALELSAQK